MFSYNYNLYYFVHYSFLYFLTLSLIFFCTWIQAVWRWYFIMTDNSFTKFSAKKYLYYFLSLLSFVLLTCKYPRRRQLSNPIGHHTLQSLRQPRLGIVFEHALQTDTQWADYVGDNGHLQSVCQTGHRAGRQMLMYSKQHLGYAEFPLLALHWI